MIIHFKMFPFSKTFIKVFLIFVVLLISLLSPHLLYGQNGRKQLNAIKTSLPVKIDGTLDEEAWKAAEPASGFSQYEPHNDRPASYETFVRVLYDDHYLYIGARMLDPEPDKILTEMSLRDGDENLNADKFWIDINPFNDGIYGYSFRVSASGVQTDVNISHGTGRRGDLSWDAVWVSATSITDEGWEVEMKIPYSALRFSTADIQQWGINFWREVRRTRESSSWNFVNRRIGDPVASMGLLNGIEGVKPPLRLALFPYTSGYLEKNGDGSGWKGTLNGGLDLKYGVNESFTIDMTLIPDFGQVQSDAKVLNLSPYEVKYDEKRQFFTEGTELFSKADLFYSRRVGARPSGYRQAYQSADENENEIVIENPIETRLINATKFSGRTKSGLGIGIFNAMTAPGHAVIKDTITGEEREFTTQAFTNYNLVVLDQSLKNNSFISLVNTNVSGMIDGYTGNVTGTEFRFLDKTGMYRISGSAALSQQYYRNTEDNFGYKYNLSAGKYGGTWQYNYSRNILSDTYNQNDLGFLQRNNLIANRISFSYNIFDPFWRLLNFSNGLSLEYRQLYQGAKFTSLNIEYNMRALFESRFFLTFSAEYEPLGRRDYFEPRVAGRFYEIGKELEINMDYSSDYRKRVYIDGEFGYQKNFTEYDQQEFSIEIRPTFRVNDKLNFVYGIELEKEKNDIGYVGLSDADDINFGIRNNTTTENTFRTSYIFNNHLSLGFDLRHYWSRVEYKDRYFLLETNGKLTEIAEDLEIPNINYNAFTIDMKLTWNFAPGSQLTAVWKNIIDSEQNELIKGYFNNMNHFLKDPQLNSFSLKILYYLDYQSLRRNRN
jgi:hypothetical protein